MKKKIAILGVTGSIGTSALKIVANHKDKFEIVFASANSNIEKLKKICQNFSIPKAIITSSKITKTDSDLDFNLYYGKESLFYMLKNEDYDILLNAIAGSPGLIYSIEALKTNRRLALANKESLVMAGAIINSILRKNSSELLPVDSEHSAIFQSINQNPLKSVRKIHLTASGGAFRDLPLKEFKNISVSNALKHPTWNMGNKITIDSATMFNKGLEVIETHWLFNKEIDKIKAIIHPQSIIHSMVEFIDGSILAQLSKPSMELPILYAFTYPDRIESNNVQTSLLEIEKLSFQKISKKRYPLFFTVVECGKKGGLLPTIVNAANEAAVDLFLKEEIDYFDIAYLVNYGLDKFENQTHPDLETIIETNKKVYDYLKRDYKNILNKMK